MNTAKDCTTCAHRRAPRDRMPCAACPLIKETHEGRTVVFQQWIPGNEVDPGESVELPTGVNAMDIAPKYDWTEVSASVRVPGEAFAGGGIDRKSNDFWKRHKQTSTHLSRAAVLDTAKELITGPREQDYGAPQANFEAIAAMWNVMLAGKLKSVGDCPISAVDVALCMVAVKMARARVTPEKGDTYVDMAGYAALAAELAGAE